MSDLSDLIPALKRAIAVPGGFDDAFPASTNSELVGLLMDAVAGAQLDRFLTDHEVDPLLETILPDTSNGPALNADGALVVVYASYQLLLSEVRNRKTHVRYQAGSAVFEEDQTAAMLNELLRQAKGRIDELKAYRDRMGIVGGATFMADLNFIKASTDYGYGVYPITAWGW
jgi:hypothetical protein